MKRFAAVLVIVLASAPAAVAQSDTQPPQLVNVSIAPSTVDVTSSAQIVTFALHATDNLSGISSAFVSLRSPSGIQNPFGSGFPPGVVLDANFAVRVQIERYSEPGTWTVASVQLTDRVGNFTFLNTAALAAAGFPTTLTVADANPDTQPPQIAAITMSPNTVDVSSSLATIVVDANFTDDLSGFSIGNSFSFDIEIRSPSGRQSRFVANRQWQLISGTVNNGVWRASFDMPRYSEPGVWRIGFLLTHDQTGNQRFFGGADLSPLGTSLELSVASSPFDVTPPQLTGLTFIPSFINTSVGPQTVETDISMTDDLSGAAFSGDTPLISSFFGAFFRSPSGGQFAFTDSTFSNAPPISGTPQNGFWRFNAFFPQFSEEGTWQVSIILRDAVRNLLFDTPAQLAALGIPNSINVIRPSLVADGTISNPAAGGTVSDSAFGTRAQLIVPGGVFTQPTTIAIDVLESPLGVPLPTGFSTAETYFVNVQLTPQPAFPLHAPGITVVMPLRNYVIPGTGIGLFRVDPVTGNLMPALDPANNPVTGHVDAGGLAATFTGVSRFSTIVGLLPNAIPVIVDIKPDEMPNVIRLTRQGTVAVAIRSTPTFDVTIVDPATMRFSGASVARNLKGKFRVSIDDVNEDGLLDVIVHFDKAGLLLQPSDTQGVVEGRTRDGRAFRGTDTVTIKLPKSPRSK